MTQFTADSAGTAPRIGSDYWPITPSDTVTFTKETAAVYVGVGGDVTLIKRNGQTVLFKNYPQGQWIPVNCIGVMDAGTTATNLVGVV